MQYLKKQVAKMTKMKYKKPSLGTIGFLVSMLKAGMVIEILRLIDSATDVIFFSLLKKSLLYNLFLFGRCEIRIQKH